MSIGFRNESSRSIVMLDGVDRVAFNEDGSLELLTPAANPTGNKVMTVSQMPFSKEYVSPEQTITAGGLLTLAHGLGVAPKLVSLELICKTAEYGFSVGDRLQIRHSLFSTSAADHFGVMVVPNSTQIRCRYGANGAAVFIEGAFSTGAQMGAGLTNANWRLIVRAWA